MNIPYIRSGDYLIPDLKRPEENRPIRKFMSRFILYFWALSSFFAGFLGLTAPSFITTAVRAGR